MPVKYVGLDGQDLALEDDSVDQARTTWTPRSIPDVALVRSARCGAPAGRCICGAWGAPGPGVARWQVRLTPIQRPVAGGCHLYRQIDPLVDDAGLEMGASRSPRGASWAFTSMDEGVFKP